MVHAMQNTNNYSGKRVLIIYAVILSPDRDSSSLRMYHLLTILRSLSFQVTFAAHQTDEPSLSQIDIFQAIDVEVLTKDTNSSIEEHLNKQGECYDIVILSGIWMAKEYMSIVRQYAPQALIIYDTISLHHLREFRGAKVTGNIKMVRRALQTKKQEIAMAQEADCTLVVSSDEKAALESEGSDIQAHILSIILDTNCPEVSFEDRKDILFIGSFQHHPNIDAHSSNSCSSEGHPSLGL